MPCPLKIRVLLFAALGVASLLASYSALNFLKATPGVAAVSTTPSARTSGFPRTILWAWERPENLDFIDPRATGVAFLARTIYLRGEKAAVRPRLQPLKVPEGTFLIAVVRFEIDRHDPPTLSEKQLQESIAASAVAATAQGVRALQIDFDATLSERTFYRRLLTGLRPKLPDKTPLTMTALASWCQGDDWLGGLPVDEAVPMLFRMGTDEHRVKAFLAGGGEFTQKLCRSSAGVSTDEPTNRPPAVERLYVFHPRAWTETAARNFFGESER